MRYCCWLIFICCYIYSFGQNQLINAVQLINGASLAIKTPSYANTRNTTAKIDDWTAEALIDGNSRIGWCSKQHMQNNNVFLIELAEDFFIEKFTFNNECQREYRGISAKQVKVELSMNKNNGFSTAGEYQLKELSRDNQFNISPTKARFVKLTIVSNHGNAEFTELMEFEAWGKHIEYPIKKHDINGVWDSNWGWVSLKTNKNGYIYGCYEYNQGTLDVGTINRRSFEFKWDERFQRGWATLVINQEGNRITGVWGFNNDRSKFGFWDFNLKTNRPNPCENDKRNENVIPKDYNIPEKTETSIQIEEKPIEVKVDEQKKPTQWELMFLVLENETNNPMNVTVNLNHKGINLQKTTNSKGVAPFSLPMNINTFRLLIEKEGYMTLNEDFNINENEKNIGIVEKTVKMTKIEIGKAIVIPNILFKQGEAVLLPSSFEELDKIVKMMEDNPKMEIELSGHTDNQGEPKLNLILSEDRVDAVKKYLVKKGIKEKRITGKGYGQTKPIADNKKEATRKLNRRVEFTVTKF